MDRVLLPQDPVLDHKFPRPIIERSHCGGIWEALEEDTKEDEGELVRDCYADGYMQPLAIHNSEVWGEVMVGKQLSHWKPIDF